MGSVRRRREVKEKKKKRIKKRRIWRTWIKKRRTRMKKGGQ